MITDKTVEYEGESGTYPRWFQSGNSFTSVVNTGPGITLNNPSLPPVLSLKNIIGDGDQIVVSDTAGGIFIDGQVSLQKAYNQSQTDGDVPTILVADGYPIRIRKPGDSNLEKVFAIENADGTIDINSTIRTAANSGQALIYPLNGLGEFSKLT